MTLSLGPLYHLYNKDEIQKSIDEAIRITKQNGIIMLAFISIYGIMDANYLAGVCNLVLKWFIFAKADNRGI